MSKPAMMLLNNACGLLPNAVLLFAYDEAGSWSKGFEEVKSPNL